MSVRETLAVSMVAATLMLLGCSSNHPRDINWGTDADLGFIPPDAGQALDAQVEESGASVDDNGGEVSGDDSIDGSQDAVAPDIDGDIDGSN